MTLGLQALLAFIPICLSGLRLIGLGWSAKRAMPLVYFVTAAIALLAWGVSLNRIAAATLEGLIITVQVLWIIFGALLLLNTLKHSGGIASIRSGIFPAIAIAFSGIGGGDLQRERSAVLGSGDGAHILRRDLAFDLEALGLKRGSTGISRRQANRPLGGQSTHQNRDMLATHLRLAKSKIRPAIAPTDPALADQLNNIKVNEAFTFVNFRHAVRPAHAHPSGEAN